MRGDQKQPLSCGFAGQSLLTALAEIGRIPPEKREVTGSTPVPTTVKVQVRRLRAPVT